MGYWENTTYINHGNVENVVTALDSIFAKEGMTRIITPQQRNSLIVEPMQYDSALHNDLWGLAVFPGAPSWTVIKTAPLELLAERATGSSHMRLADLCRQISAPAFQLNIYDDSGLILAEVSASGEIFISGCNLQSDDPFDWNGEKLDEESFEAHFQLHQFQRLLGKYMMEESNEEISNALSRELGSKNSEYCDNSVCVDTLINHKSFAATDGMAVYFKWTGQSRLRFSPCSSWDEYRAQLENQT